MPTGIEQTQQSPEKRMMLWAHPRSISTAMERSMLQRKDTTVVSEPLIHLYYSSDERSSDRYLPKDVGNIRYSFKELMAQLLNPTDTPYMFSKNMAYYVNRRRMSPELLAPFTNSFIIRNPEHALRSHHKRDKDFNFEEAGYSALQRMFDMVRNESTQTPAVIDGNALRKQPRKILEQYCAQIGISFDEAMLSWEVGDVSAFDPMYKDWVTVAENSNGFMPLEQQELEEIPDRIKRMIDQCRPHYEYLLQFAIQVPTSPPASSPDTSSVRP